MNYVIIGVGSNIDPHNNIDSAQEILAQEHIFLKASPRLETAPIGFIDQPNFINCAFLVKTNLDQQEFGMYLKNLENRLGRTRTENKYGPRRIDLDISVWEGTIIDKDYYKRDFLRKSVDYLMGNG